MRQPNPKCMIGEGHGEKRRGLMQLGSDDTGTHVMCDTTKPVRGVSTHTRTNALEQEPNSMESAMLFPFSLSLSIYRKIAAVTAAVRGLIPLTTFLNDLKQYSNNLCGVSVRPTKCEPSRQKNALHIHSIGSEPSNTNTVLLQTCRQGNRVPAPHGSRAPSTPYQLASIIATVTFGLFENWLPPLPHDTYKSVSLFTKTPSS